VKAPAAPANSIPAAPQDASLRPARRWATVGVAAAVGIIVVIAILGYSTTAALVDTAGRVERTLKTIESLDSVLLGVNSAGRARRAYFLNGDAAELPRFEEAIAQTRDVVAHVRALIADEPAQVARMDRLNPLIAERFSDLDRAIADQQARGVDDAREDTLARRGSQQLTRLAALVGEMNDIERTSLREHEQLARQSAAFAQAVDIFGTAASVAVIILAFAALRRENVRRTQSELALRAAQSVQRADRRALERATRFLDSIVEHIPDMIFVKEAGELRFERINRAGELLLGMPRQDLIGKNDYDFFPKLQADFFQEKDRETLEGGVVVDIAEEPIDTPEGRRWLHTKKVPLPGDDGRPTYLMGISQDITDSKRTAEALRSAIEASEAANRELEAFSYSVAHDLRAPLRGIDGFSQALLEDCGDKLDEAGRDHLRRVRAATDRMAELIDGLLALARLASAEVRMEDVDLSAVAAAAVDELKRVHPGRDVTVEIAPRLWTRGDPRLMRVVFDNLLGNAFKFTAKRPQAHIEFGSRFENGERVYFVRDDGVGFDAQYASRLFNAFQRLHHTRDFPGAGIGLATVQRVLRRHGGRIWAESRPDHGATFSFTVPAPAEEHPAVEPKDTKRPSSHNLRASRA
jgi:PAS domain S-box-containing protein